MCWQYSIKKRTFGFLIQNFLHVLFLKNIQSVSRRLVDAIMRWLMILQTCYCYRLSEASTILCPYSSGLGKMSDAYVLAVCDINSSISLFYMYLTTVLSFDACSGYCYGYGCGWATRSTMAAMHDSGRLTWAAAPGAYLAELSVLRAVDRPIDHQLCRFQ